MSRTDQLAFILPSAMAAIAAFLTIPLPAGYHDFADHSVVAGLHRFGDVVSNLAFLAAGLFVFARARSGAEHWLAAALCLACAGSWYYHLRPDDLRLLADRLPIAMACAGMAAIVLFDREPRRGILYAALASPVFMLAAGHAYWTGNQAVWVAAQAFVLLLLVIVAVTRAEMRAAAIATFGLYAASKLFEGLDHEVHHLTGSVSGHTIKHVLAALAPVAWFALSRRPRRESWLSQCWRRFEVAPVL